MENNGQVEKVEPEDMSPPKESEIQKITRPRQQMQVDRYASTRTQQEEQSPGL